jgi:serine/threonine protein kinase/tetratricopeptide (TPR) repeat protein
MASDGLPDSADSWRRIEEIFFTVSEAEPEAREALLDRTCDGDAALRTTVEELLRADASAGGKLEHADPHLIAGSLGLDEDTHVAGRRIGPYRVERVISHGGMGSVFLAVRDDDTYCKTVAVKIVRGAVLDRELARRFENERRILAQLEHPNIARLLDGGTTDEGVPYFVMEYVDGVPIDRYCVSLPPRERLRLFVGVCGAVQSAHQNLIVHRDLKPSNILVTTDGTPKLLDFGIAKLLADGEVAVTRTVAELRILTPEYASPEQIAGGAISTRSDVFSLGVVLCEILTGKRAPRRQPRPYPAVRSTLPGLDSDLSTIIRKAMQEDPARRYQSVQHLADDISRYLDGLPVTARPDSFSYRAGKFVRRNKTAVAGAFLIVGTLVGGIIATTEQARIAGTQRALAQHRFDAVRRLANSLLFEMHDSMQRLPGSLAARQLLVHRAYEYLDQLQLEAGDDRAVRADLATAYDRLADLTFDTATSLAMHRRAAAMYSILVAEEPANINYRDGLATSLLSVGDALKIEGKFAESVRFTRNAISVEESSAAVDHRKGHVTQMLDNAYGSLGIVCEEMGDYTSALDADERALELVNRLAAARPNDAAIGKSVVIDESHVAVDCSNLGYQREAETHVRKALASSEALLATDRHNPVYRRLSWATHRRLGQILTQTHPAEAITALLEAVVVITALSAEDPADVGHRRNLAITRIDLGDALATAGRSEDALKNYRQALAVTQSLIEADPQRSEAQSDFVFEKAKIGLLLARNGRASAPDLLAAILAGEKLRADQPENVKLAGVVDEARSAYFRGVRAQSSGPGR